MLDRLKSLLAAAGDESGGERAGDGARLAAAVLLVEAARMDGAVDAAEETAVRDLLARRFALPAREVAELVETATGRAEDSVELSTFAREIRRHFDHDERVDLVAMMWEVVLADGVVHDYEASLMRRVAGLLYVTDQESGAARRRARERLDLADDTE